MFLRIFKHLLPRALAWVITTGKQLRQFFEGLSVALGDDSKTYLDDIYLDLFPQTTRDLPGWETQWNLSPGILSEQERRDRLDATWSALGGQSPRYIQDTLQGAGFPVYVHEWWAPGTEPPVGVKSCTAPRNPFTYLFTNSNAVQAGVECGEAFAACGEIAAECGNVLSGLGYPLVNRILSTEIDYTALCGEAGIECGEAFAACGENDGYIDVPIIYTLPTDPLKWPYILYIGDSTFPNLAAIPTPRRDEFEALCLKICPAQQWLGILVAYT